MCRVTDNQRLVPFVYHKYFERYSRFKEDLMSSGYLGLVKADKRYDDNKPYAFTTFASKCILNEMRFFLRRELKHYNNRADDIDKFNDIVGYEHKANEMSFESLLKSKNQKKIASLLSIGYNFKSVAEIMGMSTQYISSEIKKMRTKLEPLREHEQ